MAEPIGRFWSSPSFPWEPGTAHHLITGPRYYFPLQGLQIITGHLSWSLNTSKTDGISQLSLHIGISNLNNFLETSGTLTPCQHGFRSCRNCEIQLIKLTSHISSLMDKGEEVDASFLDFSKAFDKVDHKKLVQKLVGLGESDGPYWWGCATFIYIHILYKSMWQSEWWRHGFDDIGIKELKCGIKHVVWSRLTLSPICWVWVGGDWTDGIPLTCW